MIMARLTARLSRSSILGSKQLFFFLLVCWGGWWEERGTANKKKGKKPTLFVFVLFPFCLPPFGQKSVVVNFGLNTPDLEQNQTPIRVWSAPFFFSQQQKHFAPCGDRTRDFWLIETNTLHLFSSCGGVAHSAERRFAIGRHRDRKPAPAKKFSPHKFFRKNAR